MLSLLPILFFVILLFIFQNFKTNDSWRVSFLKASLLWGVGITGITEILSLLRSIAFWELLGAWILSVFMALIFLFRIINQSERKVSVYPFSIPRFDLFWLFGIIFIVISVGIVAWISPPNTWDAMTYHMSRVMHWI
jgi:hypothetical protein